MSRTAVFLQGALEAVYLNEPINATAMNMSAAARNNLIFFQGQDTDGRTVLVSIPNVLFMRDESEDD